MEFPDVDSVQAYNAELARREAADKAYFDELERRMEMTMDYRAMVASYTRVSEEYATFASAASDAVDKLEVVVPGLDEMNIAINGIQRVITDIPPKTAQAQQYVAEAADLFARSSSGPLGAEASQIAEDLGAIDIGSQLQALQDGVKANQYSDPDRAAKLLGRMRILADTLRELSVEASGIAQEARDMSARTWPEDIPDTDSWRNDLDNRKRQAKRDIERLRRKGYRPRVSPEEIERRRIEDDRAREIDRRSKIGFPGYDEQGYPIENWPPRDYDPDKR